jgi:hypothetical protein
VLRLDPTPLCRGDVTALVIDGANTLCDRFAPLAWIVTSLVLTIAAAFVWRAPPRWRNRILAGATVLSLPGLYALAVRRADAPLQVRDTAVRLERIERRLEDTGGCPEHACEACQPIARFARARQGACAIDGGAPAPKSHARCEGDDLGCGAP